MKYFNLSNQNKRCMIVFVLNCYNKNIYPGPELNLNQALNAVVFSISLWLDCGLLNSINIVK